MKIPIETGFRCTGNFSTKVPNTSYCINKFKTGMNPEWNHILSSHIGYYTFRYLTYYERHRRRREKTPSNPIQPNSGDEKFELIYRYISDIEINCFAFAVNNSLIDRSVCWNWNHLWTAQRRYYRCNSAFSERNTSNRYIAFCLWKKERRRKREKNMMWNESASFSHASCRWHINRVLWWW